MSSSNVQPITAPLTKPTDTPKQYRTMPRSFSPDRIRVFSATGEEITGTPEAALSLRQLEGLEPMGDGTFTIPDPDEMTTLDIQGIHWEINRVQRRIEMNERYSKLCAQQLMFIQQTKLIKDAAKMALDVKEKYPEILWGAAGEVSIRVVLQVAARQLGEDYRKFAEEMVDCKSELQLLEEQLATETRKCRECYAEILREYGLMTEGLE